MSDPNSELNLKQLPRTQFIVAGLLVGFALFMVWDQFHWWGNREDYSFGYLVPLFAAYVLYERGSLIGRYLWYGRMSESEGVVPVDPEVRSSGWTKLFEMSAMLVFVGSAGLYGVGALLRSVAGPQNPASLAIAAGFAGILLSTVFIFTKEQVDGKPMPLRGRLGVTALFLFPALIWLISAPMVSVLETQVRVFLLTKVTVVISGLLDLLGYEIEREGNVLILPHGQVGVEEACSGIRSLTACLFAGSFLAAVFLNRFWKKVLLVGAAMCFAVLTNLLRSLFLTLWAYYRGADAIDEHWVLPLLGDIGSVHDVTGFAILGVTCVGLIALLPVFNFSVHNYADLDASDVGPASDHTNDKA